MLSRVRVLACLPIIAPLSERHDGHGVTWHDICLSTRCLEAARARTVRTDTGFHHSAPHSALLVLVTMPLTVPCIADGADAADGGGETSAAAHETAGISGEDGDDGTVQRPAGTSR